MIHRLLHLFGWNTGTVRTWWKDGRLFVGFECSGCGQMSGVEDITYRIKDDVSKAVWEAGQKFRNP